jgi:hypothetical protein
MTFDEVKNSIKSLLNEDLDSLFIEYDDGDIDKISVDSIEEIEMFSYYDDLFALTIEEADFTEILNRSGDDVKELLQEYFEYDEEFEGFFLDADIDEELDKAVIEKIAKILSPYIDERNTSDNTISVNMGKKVLQFAPKFVKAIRGE